METKLEVFVQVWQKRDGSVGFGSAGPKPYGYTLHPTMEAARAYVAEATSHSRRPRYGDYQDAKGQIYLAEIGGELAESFQKANFFLHRFDAPPPVLK